MKFDGEEEVVVRVIGVVGEEGRGVAVRVIRVVGEKGRGKEGEFGFENGVGEFGLGVELFGVEEDEEGEGTGGFEGEDSTRAGRRGGLRRRGIGIGRGLAPGEDSRCCDVAHNQKARLW